MPFRIGQSQPESMLSVGAGATTTTTSGLSGRLGTFGALGRPGAVGAPGCSGRLTLSPTLRPLTERPPPTLLTPTGPPATLLVPTVLEILLPPPAPELRLLEAALLELLLPAPDLRMPSSLREPLEWTRADRTLSRWGSRTCATPVSSSSMVGIIAVMAFAAGLGAPSTNKAAAAANSSTLLFMVLFSERLPALACARTRRVTGRRSSQYSMLNLKKVA